MKFITHLKRYIGVPYKYGGKAKDGLDCSGLISLALSDMGIKFPHGSANQIQATTPITVEQAWETPGAMLYREGHNAISLGNGTAIEAIRPKVTITKRTDTYQGKPRFTQGGLIPAIDYTSKETPMSTPRMTSPVSGRVSSPYGYRSLGGRRSLHAGMDIAAPLGTVVRAAFAGTVVKVVRGRSSGQSASSGIVLAPGRSGNGVLVRNPDGEHQLYGHVNPSVKVGDKVGVGDVLGKIDLSGITTGPHVHFEIWSSSTPSTHRNPQVDFDHFKVIAGSKPYVPAAKPAPKPQPKPPATNAKTLQVQRDLNKYANAGLIEDGIDGPVMQAWDKWVKSLQTSLPLWKDIPNLLVDGHYGPTTANAVKTLQRNNGLFPDGIAGNKTISYMQRYGSRVLNRPSNRP